LPSGRLFLFGALLVLAFGAVTQACGALSRWLALIGALIGFAVTLPLYAGFKTGHCGDAVRREGRVD
jgi:type III secretory pathway component EscT